MSNGSYIERDRLLQYSVSALYNEILNYQFQTNQKSNQLEDTIL